MILLYTESKSKRKKMLFVFWRVGVGAGRWTDRRTGPNKFAPSTSSELEAQQCINVQVIALPSSIYVHVII